MLNTCCSNVDAGLDSVRELDVNETIVPSNSNSCVSALDFGTTEEVALIATGNEDENIEGAKIVGSYESVLKMMYDKHAMKDHKLVGNVICLDSFDGAEHMRSRKKRVSLISFSSQLFSKDTIKKGCTTSSSGNILTWQQFLAEEKASTIFPAVRTTYEEKKS